MLNETFNHIRIPKFLHVATYIGIVAMSILGISGLTSLRSQIWALGLICIFGLLYHFVFWPGHYEKNPALYFGAQITTLTLLFLLRSRTNDAFNFLLLMLSVHVAVISPIRVAAIWITLFFSIVSILNMTAPDAVSFYPVFFYFAIFVICGFFGYVVRQAEQAREHNQKLLEELQSTQSKLQGLAILDERNRLARDLHDSVKQQVFAISMQLSAARTSLTETDKAYSSIVQAEKLAQQAGLELTTLIHELRPPDLKSKSIKAALQEYVTEWAKRNNIVVSLNIYNDLPLNINEEQVFFRVAQEALSNVARHSQATHVSIELIYEDSHIIFCIADNGKGFEVEQTQKGVGLNSMQERLTQIDASFHVQSKKDGGTQITAKLKR